jgi:hypothetical protein
LNLWISNFGPLDDALENASVTFPMASWESGKALTIPRWNF